MPKYFVACTVTENYSIGGNQYIKKDGIGNMIVDTDYVILSDEDLKNLEKYVSKVLAEKSLVRCVSPKVTITNLQLLVQ